MVIVGDPGGELGLELLAEVVERVESHVDLGGDPLVELVELQLVHFLCFVIHLVHVHALRQ